MKIRPLYSILFMLLPLCLPAQEVQFKAQAPSVVNTGERFMLKYSMNIQPDAFNAPDLNNFRYSGPSQSSSFQSSYVNGKLTQSVTIEYSYVVVADKPGTYSITPATIIVKGKTYTSNALNIDVVGNATTHEGNTTTSPSQNRNTSDLFVLFNVHKNEVYQGEQISANIKLYTRKDIMGFEDSKLPSFTGFWAQEIERSGNVQLEQENVNGTPYNTGILYNYILYPQRSGDLIIDPFTIDVVLGKRMSWFGMQRAGVQHIASPEVKIKVKPLPAKPAGFSGAVGTFTMKAKIDKDSLPINDAVTLKIDIAGNGNLQLVGEPAINFPPDLDVFDPKIDQQSRTTLQGMTGTKSFEYVIIPRSAGNFRVPPIKFIFFDPAKGQYTTLTSDEYNLVVTATNQQDQFNIMSGIHKQDVTLLSNDIRFIKNSNFKLRPKGDVFFGSKIFYLMYIVPLSLFIAIFVWRRKQVMENANLQLLKNKRASKISRRRLKYAAQYLKQQNKDAFYTEISQAMWGYLSDKLNIPLSELTKENITHELNNRNLSSDTVNSFVQILDNCEFARYAPTSDSLGMETIYSSAEDIISKLESQLKK